MFLVIGTLIHMITGAGLRFFLGWRFGVVAAIFAAKEFGELKHVVAGSITSLEKNLIMVREVFTNPFIVPQWLLPAICAWLVGIAIEKAQLRKFPSCAVPGREKGP